MSWTNQGTALTYGTKTLSNNTNTSIANVTVASNTVAAGIVRYSVEVFDGTDLQVEVGIISFRITNKAGTQANNVTSKFGNTQATTSGTLTVTWTITAANPGVLTINANSSLTLTASTAYVRTTYEIQNLTQQNQVTV